RRENGRTTRAGAWPSRATSETASGQPGGQAAPPWTGRDSLAKEYGGRRECPADPWAGPLTQRATIGGLLPISRRGAAAGSGSALAPPMPSKGGKDQASYDSHRLPAVLRLQVHRLRRGLPRRVLLLRREDALHRPERLHRLRGVRPRVPRRGDL